MRKNPTELSEQVFENRNKAYGAYKLRRAYFGILLGATIFVIVAMLFIFGGSPLLDGDFGEGETAQIVIVTPAEHKAPTLAISDTLSTQTEQKKTFWTIDLNERERSVSKHPENN